MTEIARRQTFDPRRPFNRAEARAAGISLDALLGPRFQKICWDTYLARDVPVTPQIRSLAALRLAPPGTHISHETAAQLWGAVVPGGPTTHITTPTGHGRLVRRGIKSHYYESYEPRKNAGGREVEEPTWSTKLCVFSSSTTAGSALRTKASG